ncbi:MAG: hypothetical protein Q9173_002660 [Seirophora scorigena]
MLTTRLRLIFLLATVAAAASTPHGSPSSLFQSTAKNPPYLSILGNPYPIPNSPYSIDFDAPGPWLNSFEARQMLPWARRRYQEHIRKNHDGHRDLKDSIWHFQTITFGIVPEPSGGVTHLKWRDALAIVDAFQLKVYREGYREWAGRIFVTQRPGETVGTALLATELDAEPPDHQ